MKIIVLDLWIKPTITTEVKPAHIKLFLSIKEKRKNAPIWEVFFVGQDPWHQHFFALRYTQGKWTFLDISFNFYR